MFSKSQISMEFMLIFTLVLFISVAFLKTLHQNLSDLQDKNDAIAMENLVNEIKNELILALQVHDNYIRRFDIPYKLNGKNYTLNLQEDELIINITEGKSKQLRTFLPHEMKGSFLKNNELGFLDYCITKDNDEIRVSRNQVNLEYAARNRREGDDDDFDYDATPTETLSLRRNHKFRIYLRINCVFNLQSITFLLSYNKDKLDYKRPIKPIDHSPVEIGALNVMSHWMREANYYEDECTEDEGEGITYCRVRVNIIKQGRGPLGSGIVAEFEFKAIEEGETFIDITDLELYDASISPTNEGNIPPSSVGISVEILE
ncbi:hypothetical protein HYY70_04645 [Candidatus Woesearchaeota archaeon]|nr:hypothetical protein [Candidatus Woesearchaeota archaeon]